MKRVSAVVVASLFLAGCASKPKPVDAQPPVDEIRYTADEGTIPVGVIPEGALRDNARKKDLGLAIDYPTRGGPNPVIIFSHGLGSAPRDYTSFASYWASHGYVVIRPAHADARRKGDVRPDSESLEKQSPADWKNRTQDISFIIDSLTTLEQQYPELSGKMNHDLIGVAGYSFGAFTAMQIGGVRTMLPGQIPVSYQDPRVKLILAYSPQGPSESRGLNPDSWRELNIPTLFMTGSADIGSKPEENAAWRRLAFDLSPAGDKWFVLLQGAGHSTFTGRSSAPVDAPTDEPVRTAGVPSDPFTPPGNPGTPGTTTGTTQVDPSQRPRTTGSFEKDRQIFRSVLSISRAFFDAYLKKQPKGLEFLNKLTERSDIEVAKK